MQDFLLYSLIASIVLTALLNFLPVLFPRQAEKAGRKLQEKIEASIENPDADEGIKVKVFFPWKTMLLLSIGLTLVVNLAAYFAGG